MSLLSSLAVRSSFARTPRPATPQACSDTSKTACRACVASLHWLDVGHMIPSKTLEAVERRTGHRNSVDSGWALCGRAHYAVVSRNHEEDRAHSHLLKESDNNWLSCTRIVIWSLTLPFFQINFILWSNHPLPNDLCPKPSCWLVITNEFVQFWDENLRRNIVVFNSNLEQNCV